MLLIPALQILNSEGYLPDNLASFSIYTPEGEVEDMFSYGSGESLALEIRYKDGLLVNPADLDTICVLSEYQLFPEEVVYHIARWKKNPKYKHAVTDEQFAHRMALSTHLMEYTWQPPSRNLPRSSRT